MTPSRARHDAVYEPPGPPPITRTVVSVGIDIFDCVESSSCEIDLSQTMRDDGSEGDLVDTEILISSP